MLRNVNFLDQVREFCTVILFACFGGVARSILVPHKGGRSLLSFAGSMLCAAFAGVLVYKMLSGFNCSDEYCAAGVGVAGLISDDLLGGLIALGKRIREHPKEFIDEVKKIRK